MIVGIKKTRDLFNVTIWSNAAYPIASYANVKAFVDNELPSEFEELYIEAVIVKYVKERAEVYVYTKVEK